MKKTGLWLLVVLAAAVFTGSVFAHKYARTRDFVEKELNGGNYPLALARVNELKNSVVLFPLRFGTPFFLKNVAAEISFIEAEAWHKLGEKRKALESYQKAAELFRGTMIKERASAFYNAAVIALEQGKYLEARELLHKALDPVSGNPYHAGAKANLERIEAVAVKEGLPSAGDRRPRQGLYEERDPLSPWSGEKSRQEGKVDRRR